LMRTTILFNNHFPSNVTVFFSSRAADFSLIEKHHGLPSQQSEALKKQLGFSLPPVFNIQQVHGAEVKVLSSVDPHQPIPKADALITQQENVPLCVRTADCLPIFFVDPVTRAIALAHAGWRSTRAGIVSEVVNCLQTECGTKAADLLVGFGPCIRACCYEVGGDVAQSFPEAVVRAKERISIDLSKENIRQLEDLGVSKASIKDEGRCTCCSPDFFSFRREGEKAGRHLSVLILNSQKNDQEN